MRKLNCIVCGEVAEFGSYCKEHYLKKESLFSIPASMEVELCRECGSHFQGLNKISLDDAIRKQIESKGTIEGFSYKINRNTITITATGEINGVEKEESHDADFRQRKRMCIDCQKRSGGYFEATVQIRPKFEWALPKIKTVEEIVKVEELKEGYDVYMINKASANKIAARLAKWIIERKDTRKLFGEKDGASVYRNVTLLRLREKIKTNKDQE